MPEFPLNSDIFCKNSLEIRCLNKFRFDIRPLYLNSLCNVQFIKLSVLSVLEWWRHLIALMLPPLDSQLTRSSLTWREFTPGECLLWLEKFYEEENIWKRCWRARSLITHIDATRNARGLWLRLCNYRRFEALNSCTLYPSYSTLVQFFS